MSFLARYPGTCPECQDDIEVGEVICSRSKELGGGYIHLICPTEVKDPPPAIEPGVNYCLTCFQIKSLSGACACT